MEQSPSWEANSRLLSHEIRCLLSDKKVHYRVYNIMTLDRILNPKTSTLIITAVKASKLAVEYSPDDHILRL